MTGMTRKGVHLRAREAKAAANRLRWEVDLSVGVWPNTYTPRDYDYGEAVGAVNDIAETLAILKNTLDAIEEHVPEKNKQGILLGHIRERFASALERYTEFHKVGR